MEDTEIRSIIQVDRIKIENRENLVEQIIFSEPFRCRIQSGLRRILKEQAEAGFNVFIYEDELIFGKLVLGERRAIDAYDLSLGLGKYPSVALPNPGKEIEDYGWTSYFKTKPRRIAEFHFHPRGSGFSGNDLDLYERDKDKDALEDKKITRWGNGNLVLYEKEDLSMNLIDGLVSPVIRRVGKKSVIT